MSMFSVLPDSSSRDILPLWYITNRNLLPPSTSPDDNSGLLGHNRRSGANLNGNGGGRRTARSSAALIERTPLARLRADELYIERRLLNISNFGSTWLKPPGVSKSLYQIREERREADEHAEALRREQLAQELASAAGEPAGTEGLEAGLGTAEDDGAADPMDEDAAAGGRDLDDDIPDADDDDFGFDGVDDDDEDGSEGEETTQRRETRNQLASMRANEDRVREMIARNHVSGGGGDLYEEEEEIDEEDRAQILEEEDLVHAPSYDHGGLDPDMEDMDMGTDLDDDIPEAESAGYEHTDTEAELSSDDGDNAHNVSYAAPAPQRARFRTSLARSDATRNSLDISGILSRDGSSVLGSSPHVRARNRGER